jgi:hypothetical protein
MQMVAHKASEAPCAAQLDVPHSYRKRYIKNRFFRSLLSLKNIISRLVRFIPRLLIFVILSSIKLNKLFRWVEI